jgi:hypothetical protein
MRGESFKRETDSLTCPLPVVRCPLMDRNQRLTSDRALQDRQHGKGAEYGS